jgi:hypothetical protein
MILASLMTATTLADGFICLNDKQDLKVQVYNHSSSELGTRKASVLVLSHTQRPIGQRTIAKFAELEGTLISHGATYTGQINDSVMVGDGEKAIGGVSLFKVNYLMIDIDFTYEKPLKNGDKTTAMMNLIKTDRETESSIELEYEMVCTRYLKK